ncbi:hypothetical protein L1987_15387 [Smallanthus sonchifolius]|uniref:Uncharacterized protein n=1 Tax=Smallanthus sonchifolius TaxID=185202 RepID=A0ACB9J5H0_9ASTR|nr:hypothetical protein L1987_15387 [Smallanthus sonchifolius]
MKCPQELERERELRETERERDVEERGSDMIRAVSDIDICRLFRIQQPLMGKVGEEMEFIASTGDNFYDNGLVDGDDTAFLDSFTNVYTTPSLQKQWYSVLGNHDYRGNALTQLSPELRQRDNRWLCMRSFSVNIVEKSRHHPDSVVKYPFGAQSGHRSHLAYAPLLIGYPLGIHGRNVKVSGTDDCLQALPILGLL